MAEDKNYTNNTERPREDEELEIDLMEYVRKLWAARKMLLKVAGIGAIVGGDKPTEYSQAKYGGIPGTNTHLTLPTTRK